MDIFEESNKAYDNMSPEDKKACDSMTNWEWQHYMLDHPDHFGISEDSEILRILRSALPEKDPESYSGEKEEKAKIAWNEHKADYQKFFSNLPEYIHEYLAKKGEKQ